MAQSSSKKKYSPVASAVCLWGHLCSLSSIDKERNNLSLFNIIEQFNLPQGAFDEHTRTGNVIVIPYDYEIVLQWARTLDIGGINDELKFDFSIKLVDPNGTVIQQTFASTSFPTEMRGVNFRLRTNAIAITLPGKYRYEIETKNDREEFVETNSIPIEITSIKTDSNPFS